MIGTSHHIGIVLDNQHGVALIAQVAKCVDHRGCVFRMQSNRRLVEHIARADQTRSQTGGESCSLILTAGERACRTIERQVVRSDANQEFQTLPNRRQRAIEDSRCRDIRSLPRSNDRCRFADSSAQQLRQRGLSKLNAACERIQPSPLTFGTQFRPFALLRGDRVVIRLFGDKHAETSALQARSVRAVEAERARFEFRKADAAIGAGETAAVSVILPAVCRLLGQHDCAVAVLERQFDRLAQSSLQPGLHDDPIDDRFDRVRLRLGERRRLRGFDHVAVHASTHEAGLRDRLKDLAMRPTFSSHQRSHDQHLAALFERKNLLDDLLSGASGQRPSTLWAMSLATSSKQQPQVIEDFRRRRQRAPQRRRSRRLTDADRRRQAVDDIDIWPLPNTDARSCLGRQTF